MFDSQFVPLRRLLSDVKGGGTPGRDVPDYWNGAIPWATVKDFRDGTHVLNATQESISEQGLKKSASRLIPARTPIICTRMAVGRIAMADFAVAINQDLKALFPKAGVDPSYLLRAVESVRSKIEAISIGSTVRGISLDQLLSLEVFFPNNEREQKKIAEVFSTLDGVIEQTQALIAKQRRIKNGLMQDLFSKGIDGHGNVRNETTHPFKDSPVGRIPLEWEALALRDACDYITDGVHVSVQKRESGIPFLFVSCIREGRITLNDVAYVDEDTYRVVSRGCEPKPGVVLYTVVGSYGNAAEVTSDMPFAFERNIAYLVPTHSKILPAYLSSWLNSERGKLTADKFALGNAQKLISLGQLGEFVVPIPRMEEQERISKELTSLESSLLAQCASHQKLMALKAGLMHDLLTGERPVAELLD
jgi:type I restriction enzyme S subunit